MLIKQKELARILNVSLRTIQYWRENGIIDADYKAGARKSIGYDLDKVLKMLDFSEKEIDFLKKQVIK